MQKNPQQSNPVLLGIEGGGTRTVALLVHGAQAWRMEAAAANLHLVTDAQMLRLFQQIEAWRERLGPRLDAVAIGLAGARTTEDKERILNTARQVWPGLPCKTAGDLETGLAAAGPWPPASKTRRGGGPEAAARVLVLSGTGSCCFGADTAGRTYRLGGWGHQLGDRGSAYDIALRALRQTVHAYDLEGRWPSLGQRLLRVLLLNDPEDLVGWIRSADKTEVAALAVEVFAAAGQKDRIAGGVLREVATTLTLDATGCAAHLIGRGRPVEFVLAGSVLLKQPAFAATVRRALRAAWPQARVLALTRESAWGAIELARAALAGAQAVPDQAGAARSDRTAPIREGRGLAHWDSELGRTSPTEQRNPRSRHLDRLSLAQAIELMAAEDETIPGAIRAETRSIERALKRIVRAFRQGGRLFYVGAGTSGRLGVLDASECPPTFRTPPAMVQGIMAGGVNALWQSVEGAEDDAAAGARALEFRQVAARDVVVGIAASGRTPFVWGALQEAERRGATTVLLCCNPNLRIPRAQRPTVVIALNTGPEVLTGSTRLKAGTATKMVLNMLTTLSMVRLGKVVQNLMVDVNPSNVKLRDRALRIVQALTDTEEATARAALVASDWAVKRAVLRVETVADRA